MKRVFAAIDISEEARQAIAAYVNRAKEEFLESRVRWERPEKLHITLKFAGSLKDEELSEFVRRVESAAALVAPFAMRIVGTGSFVKRRGLSVLWLGAEIVGGEQDVFERLSALLSNEAVTRPFKPHITIARIKDAKVANPISEKHLSTDFKSAGFPVNEVVVYESKLLPSGSVYSVIKAVKLSGSVRR